eukprot:gene32479-42076_t
MKTVERACTGVKLVVIAGNSAFKLLLETPLRAARDSGLQATILIDALDESGGDGRIISLLVRLDNIMREESHPLTTVENVTSLVCQKLKVRRNFGTTTVQVALRKRVVLLDPDAVRTLVVGGYVILSLVAISLPMTRPVIGIPTACESGAKGTQGERHKKSLTHADTVGSSSRYYIWEVGSTFGSEKTEGEYHLRDSPFLAST